MFHLNISMLSSLLLKNLPYKHRKRATNGETLICTSCSHHSSLRPKVAGATSEKHLLGQTSTPDYQVNSPPVGILKGTASSNRPLQGTFFFGGPSEEFLGLPNSKAARCEIPSLQPGSLFPESTTAVGNQGGAALARTPRGAPQCPGTSWAWFSGRWAGFGKEEPPGSRSYNWKGPPGPTARTRNDPEGLPETDCLVIGGWRSCGGTFSPAPTARA